MTPQYIQWTMLTKLNHTVTVSEIPLVQKGLNHEVFIENPTLVLMYY